MKVAPTDMVFRRGEATKAIQARQVLLWDQEARSDPARRCMVRIKKVLL